MFLGAPSDFLNRPSWGVGGEKSCSPIGVRVVRSCFACAKLDWWSIAERGEVIGVLVGVSGGTLVLGRFSPDSGCCWIDVQRLPVRASCGARLTPSPPRSSPCAPYAPGRPSTTNLVVDCGTWARSGLGEEGRPRRLFRLSCLDRAIFQSARMQNDATPMMS